MKLIFVKAVFSSLLILGGFLSSSAQSAIGKSETSDNMHQIENEKLQKEKLALQSDDHKMTEEYAVDEKKYDAILMGTPQEMTDESLKVFQENINQWIAESPDPFLVLDEKEETLYNNGEFKKLYMYSLQKRNASKK